MRALFALLLSLMLASPAMAHSLRVFARVSDGQVSGYGFFIGGGRPAGASWSAQMGEQPLGQGVTDAAGGFTFAAPEVVGAPVTVTLNTGEGHIAHATLPPERFDSTGAPQALPAARVAPVPGAKPPAAPDPAALAALVEAATARATAREVAPLLERIEAMDARMRLTDLISGLCLIAGLAGIALWARGRRR